MDDHDVGVTRLGALPPARLAAVRLGRCAGGGAQHEKGLSDERRRRAHTGVDHPQGGELPTLRTSEQQVQAVHVHECVPVHTAG